MGGIDAEQLTLGFLWYVGFLLSLTAHEAAHAWAALKLGDPTAYQGGQVTLNPWPHVRRSPFGTVVVPILSFALQGWMIGWASAPYDPVWAERHPKKEGLMAAAGPAANLLLVALAGLAIRAGLAAGAFTLPLDHVALDRLVVAEAGWASGLAPLLSILFSLNLILFVFNLFPLPPLDGSAVYPPLFGEEAARKFKRLLAAQPALSLLGLVVAWKLFGPVFQPVLRAAVGMLYAGLG
jgi:Zn-dependent protease